MNVYVVIASPPRGYDEPWISDVFTDKTLAMEYAAEMNELRSEVVYHIEQYEIRTSLNSDADRQWLKDHPTN